VSKAAEQIFTADHLVFPYLYKFPGQASDEKILFVTRESDIVLLLRQLGVVFAAGMIFFAGVLMGNLLTGFFGESIQSLLEFGSAVVAVGFGILGFWWVTTLWKRSLAIITNKRLTKFIYTTPWNRHNLSLPLDMVVDTGAYNKGILQALFKLGTFTARSSASSSGVATDDPGRVNKKYFYIENVMNAEDIHHYLNKVLFVYRQDWTKLENFRPFLPHLKGDARKEFMKQYPEYWS
jgi:hypothetical protein